MPPQPRGFGPCGRPATNGCLFVGFHIRLQIHPQPVGDAIDVVEVRHHLYDVVDGAVVESLTAQSFHVCPLHLSGRLGQLDREIKGRRRGFIQLRLTVISLDLFEQPVVIQLRPELLGVGQYSVVAVVDLRDYRGEHLPQQSRDGQIGVHGL